RMPTSLQDRPHAFRHERHPEWRALDQDPVPFLDAHTVVHEHVRHLLNARIHGHSFSPSLTLGRMPSLTPGPMIAGSAWRNGRHAWEQAERELPHRRNAHVSRLHTRIVL